MDGSNFPVYGKYFTIIYLLEYDDDLNTFLDWLGGKNALLDYDFLRKNSDFIINQTRDERELRSSRIFKEIEGLRQVLAIVKH